MQSIKQVQRLNEAELEKAVPPSASWHTDYRDTAYIYIGGLPFDLTEGDIITIFSQYGDPVWIKLARDKETGKSRGFAWLKYEDQRSCDLAVDNLSGATVMGRMLAIDHTRYKKRDDEDEMEGYVGQAKLGPDKDEGTTKRRRVDVPEDSESEEERRPMIKEEIELAKMLEDHDEEDPMKAYMIQSKKEEVEEALKNIDTTDREGTTTVVKVDVGAGPRVSIGVTAGATDTDRIETGLLPPDQEKESLADVIIRQNDAAGTTVESCTYTLSSIINSTLTIIYQPQQR